jgi:cytochrome c-type biogenesis protein
MRAAALADHLVRRSRAARVGSVALAVGLSASFAGTGVFLTSLSFSVGVDPATFRLGIAALMLIIGVVLLVPALQSRFALVAAPVATGGQAVLDRLRPSGIGGQFALGILLGAIWSPCSGPTLGTAIGLKSRRCSNSNKETLP